MTYIMFYGSGAVSDIVSIHQNIHNWIIPPQLNFVVLFRFMFPIFQFPYNQLSQFRLRKRQKVHHFVDSSKKFIVFEMLLQTNI